MSLSNSALTGVTLPTAKYVNSIGEEFPNGNRTYKVESSISNRYLRDYLPINANISSGSVTDCYVDFMISSNQNEFIDCESFTIETKLEILKADGSVLDDACNVSVVDGLAHRLFTKCSVSLNGVPCENNNYFGIYNMLKTYLSMGKHELSSLGRNSYYKDVANTTIVDSFTATDFTANTVSPDEKEIIKECKKPLHFMTPVNLDISSANFFL